MNKCLQAPVAPSLLGRLAVIFALFAVMLTYAWLFQSYGVWTALATGWLPAAFIAWATAKSVTDVAAWLQDTHH